MKRLFTLYAVAALLYSCSSDDVKKAPIKITAQVQNSTSHHSDDGFIKLTVTGGSGTYTYAWSNGKTTKDIDGLSAGGYSVIVSDNSGATASDSYSITEPPSAEDVLLETVTRLKQAGLRIVYHSKIIYIDPINIMPGKTADADIIMITHSHGDHYNKDVLNQLINTGTTFLVPGDIYDEVVTLAGTNTVLKVAPDSLKTVNGIDIEVVPAYNIVKDYHHVPNSVGYILTLDGLRFYHSGDTELIPEMADFNVDIACIPLGQTYTFLSVAQAVEAAKSVGASLVMPIHYGVYEGTAADAVSFKNLLKGEIDVTIKTSIE